MKNLISRKRRESLREYLKESEDANPQDRVNVLRKKLNNLPKTSDDNNDSEDKVLKKVSKEIVNDDNNDSEDKVLKKVSAKLVNDDNKDNDNNDSENKILKKVSK